MIGVDALTAHILEQRVALEACRPDTAIDHAINTLRTFLYTDTDSMHVA